MNTMTFLTVYHKFSVDGIFHRVYQKEHMENLSKAVVELRKACTDIFKQFLSENAILVFHVEISGNFQNT